MQKISMHHYDPIREDEDLLAPWKLEHMATALRQQFYWSRFVITDHTIYWWACHSSVGMTPNTLQEWDSLCRQYR